MKRNNEMSRDLIISDNVCMPIPGP